MKKSLFAFILVVLVAVTPSCTTGYDEVEERITLEKTNDPDTGTDGGGPVDPPPPGVN